MLLRNSDIVPISDMTGIIEFVESGKSADEFLVSRVLGFSYVFQRRCRKVGRDSKQRSEIRCGTRFDPATHRRRCPYLDVVAAINSSGTNLHCLRQSPPDP